MIRKKRRGEILAENIVFIILNLLFLSTMILFIYSKTGSESVLEEKYAKQIALIIDSAESGMVVHLNMEDALAKAEKNFGEGNIDNIVSISGNTVKGGYSYDFFNNIEVSSNFDTQNKNEYFFVFG